MHPSIHTIIHSRNDQYFTPFINTSVTTPSTTLTPGTSNSCIPVSPPDPTSSHRLSKSLLSFGFTSGDAVPTVTCGIAFTQGRSVAVAPDPAPPPAPPPPSPPGMTRATKAIILLSQTTRSRRTLAFAKTGVTSFSLLTCCCCCCCWLDADGEGNDDATFST